MPNSIYPKEIYLQNNLRLAEKRTVRNDARLIGLDRHAGPTAIPNYSIPLTAWLNERIIEGDIVFDCNCDNCFNPITKNNLFKFEDNGLSYQFLDILQNDVFNRYNNVTIEILSTDFGGDRSVEIVQIPYYNYPIIKLTKPSGSFEVNNIDAPESFVYKITDSCGDSNTSTVIIYPTFSNLDVIINNSII